jgi:hypothetical protein
MLSNARLFATNIRARFVAMMYERLRNKLAIALKIYGGGDFVHACKFSLLKACQVNGFASGEHNRTGASVANHGYYRYYRTCFWSSRITILSMSSIYERAWGV